MVDADPLAHRLETARALVGYTPDDELRVRTTGAILLPQADAIAGAVYNHLLSHPETAAYFTRPDGTRDDAQLATRAGTLKAWLASVIEGPLDERAAKYAARVGRAHAQIGGGGPARVDGRYMVAAIGFVASAIPSLLDAGITDRRELVAAIIAWNKLLAIQLDLFLATYAGAASDPDWY